MEKKEKDFKAIMEKKDEDFKSIMEKKDKEFQEIIEEFKQVKKNQMMKLRKKTSSRKIYQKKILKLKDQKI